MPNIELTTVFSISLRFLELSAMRNSNCNYPGHIGKTSFLIYKSLVEIITISTPPFNSKPNCRLFKKSNASEFASLAKHLAISLLQITIGQLMGFFNKADTTTCIPFYFFFGRGEWCFQKSRKEIQHFPSFRREIATYISGIVKMQIMFIDLDISRIARSTKYLALIFK